MSKLLQIHPAAHDGPRAPSLPRALPAPRRPSAREPDTTLRRRCSILAATHRLAEALLGARRDWLDSAPAWLADVAAAAGMTHVGLYQNRFRADGRREAVLCAGGRPRPVCPAGTSAHSAVLCFQATGLSRWETVLASGQLLQGGVSEFPPEEQALLRRLGVRSLLVLPLLVEAEWWGSLWLADHDRERVWLPVEREALGAVAELLGAALMRERRETHASDQQWANRFLRSGRIESLGLLASGVAHDLNNALAPVRIGLDLLKDKFTDAEGRQVLSMIAESAGRVTDIVQQILSFARGGEGKRVRIDLGQLTKGLIRLAQETFPKSVHLRAMVPGHTWPVHGDPTQLYQVLLNLSLNACDAMPSGGDLTLRTENVELDEAYVTMEPAAQVGSYVVIMISDTGLGMSQETRQRLFEPFFTTKPAGKGTGLGLATSLAIVKSHGGFIRVETEPQRGSTFKVYWPAAPATPAAPTLGPIETRPTGHGEGVLVVDDEDALRHLCGRILARHGYRVFTAANGAEAVARYAAHRGEIELVLMDLLMPVMDGAAGIQALRSLNPTLRIVATTGLGSERSATEAATATVQALLAKPVNSGDLLSTVARVLSRNPELPAHDPHGGFCLPSTAQPQ
ncbi:MAG: response regulator [Verrucomicrobia bacterium]|nr:response regulator [Verrucomicrobiota bacterium]